jgi:hypothetical protein
MVDMRSTRSFGEGDAAYDAHNNRIGIITHCPEPGTWVCLGHPGHPDDTERRWHTLYGDLRPVDNGESTA